MTIFIFQYQTELICSIYFDDASQTGTFEHSKSYMDLWHYPDWAIATGHAIKNVRHIQVCVGSVATIPRRISERREITFVMNHVGSISRKLPL
jgi:hypothetical protein